MRHILNKNVLNMKKTIILVLIALIALSACTTKVVMPSEERLNVLTASGSSEFDVNPDVAKLRIGVRTQSMDAKEAQAMNSQLSNAVQDALVKAGVRKNEIETTNYNLYKQTRWEPKTQTQVDVGYEVTNTVVLATKDLPNVGKLIDTAVQAGANNVESISFELSDEMQKQVKSEALSRAAQNAHEKAVALADGAGVALGKVVSISESGYNYMPYRTYGLDMVAMGAKAEAAPTPISPQSVSVSAQVSVSYELA